MVKSLLISVRPEVFSADLKEEKKDPSKVYVLKDVSLKEKKNYLKEPLKIWFHPFKVPNTVVSQSGSKDVIAIEFIEGAHPKTVQDITTIVTMLTERDKRLLQDSNPHKSKPSNLNNTVYEIFRRKLKLEDGYPRLSNLTQGLPVFIQHGDFHPGNIILTTAGTYLIDFDDIGSLPLGWDLIELLASASCQENSPLPLADADHLLETYSSAFPLFGKQLSGVFKATRSLFSIAFKIQTTPRTFKKDTLIELGFQPPVDKKIRRPFMVEAATLNAEWLFENLPSDARCNNCVDAPTKINLMEKYLPFESLDFAAIQEVESVDVFKQWLASQDPQKWAIVASNPCRYKQRTAFIYRADKWDILGKEKIKTATPKILHTRLSSKLQADSVIDVYSVHLASGVFDEDKKSLRIRTCKDIAKHHKKSPDVNSQLLIMGDFNDVDADGTCVDNLTRDFNLIGSARVLPEGSSSLYSSRRDQHILVDHILTSGRFTRTSLLETVKWSDHRGLVASIQFGDVLGNYS